MGYWKYRWIQTPQRILMDPCIKQAPVLSKWFWIIPWPLAYNRLELDCIRKIINFWYTFGWKWRVFVTIWDCRTHVRMTSMTSSVERTDLDFKISVALQQSISSTWREFWGMILQWASTIKVSIELPVATRHYHDMTEKLLKAMLDPNKQHDESLSHWNGVLQKFCTMYPQQFFQDLKRFWDDVRVYGCFINFALINWFSEWFFI